MNAIEMMIAMFLLFAVGLLIGYVEGNSQGWDKCGKFYREEIIPNYRKGKR